MDNGPVVELRGVTVGYGGTPVVRSVDLSIAAGETVAVLGPSGSGKTTLLFTIAGFLPLDAGEVWLAGKRVATPEHSEPPDRRPVAMVFQHYGLWPHLDALETVAYPLRRQHMSGPQARAEAQAFLDQLRVGHLAGRRPQALSGGEQQRVGLARALARRPQVYLLDEPTAHLDTPLKAELQDELASRRSRDQAAAIIATHDVEEALALADRVVLLRDGAVVQVGTPVEVYARPHDEWAARLTGPSALIEGALEVADGTATLVAGDTRMKLDTETDFGAPRDGRWLVRPDWVTLGGPLAGSVDEVRYRGSHTDYRVRTAAGALLVREPGSPRFSVGDSVAVGISRVWPIPDAS
jgi:ABC-type Fe3+/spermidine/putrescine transport system ATPase subunit